MSGHAFVIGRGSGAAVTPVGACGWDERFDEPSLAALMAKYPYPMGGSSWNNNLAGTVALSGGRLLLSGGYGFTMSPGEFPPGKNEVWYRIEMEMIGGAYDWPMAPSFALFDVNMHGGEVISPTVQALMGLRGARTSPDPGDMPAISGNVWTLLAAVPGPPYPNIGTVSSSISDLMAVGAHTIILFFSGSSGVAKFWYDPAVGDPPDATQTVPAFTTPFRFHQSQFNGPQSTTLAIGRITMTCGGYSSDPFGIL